MNERNNNNAVKILLGIAIVVILAIIFILVYKNFGPSSSKSKGTDSKTEVSEATEAAVNDTEEAGADDTADVTESAESESTEAAGTEAAAEEADAALITITIEVIDNEEQSVEYVVETDAEFLRQAMEESDMEFSGTESSYGMMVETVNGLTADWDADGAYWAFYVDGEYCNYGIDSQPIADGEHYQIIYTAGM